MNNWKKISQSLLASGVAGLLLAAASQAHATTAVTASGALTVEATVASSIQLTFNTATSSGLTLTSGAGTNAATLNFGTVTEYGSAPTNVTIATSSSLCSSCFVASTNVSIVVNAADSSSSGFSLAASVSAPTHGEVLAVGSSGALSTNATSPTPITGSFTYGSSGNAVQVSLGIPTATADSTQMSDVITFVATAN